MIEKFGVDNPSKSKDILNRKKSQEWDFFY
jgi:hypothetical protein